MGPPSVHMYNSWLRAAMKKMEGKEHLKQDLEELTSRVQHLKGWEELHKDFPVVRIQKCYNSSHKKILLGIPRLQMPESGVSMTGAISIYPAVLEFLKQQKGFKALEGVAPPGDLERRIQRALDMQ
eukprot:10349069-Karenia_brevis.AAC.1